MMQATPPEMTETSVDVSAATAPASVSPRRGPPWTTAIWNEDSRLRMASGIELCRMVLRSTAEITSAQPAMASATSATGRVAVKPNRVIARPHSATATTTARPRRTMLSTQPVVEAPSSPPMAGAA